MQGHAKLNLWFSKKIFAKLFPNASRKRSPLKASILGEPVLALRKLRG